MSWNERLAVIRDVLLVGLALMLGWKLIGAEWTISPGDLPLSEMLTLVLGLFAIALSAAFFFKASEASSRFYNDTYHFTKDVSEVLGRIEAGFGERLRSLEEGYASVRDTFLAGSSHTGDEEVRQKAKEELEEAKKIRDERDAIIRDLMQRAHLQEAEKHEIADRLRSKEKELAEARREAQRLRRLSHLESARQDPGRIEALVRRYVRGSVIPLLLSSLAREGIKRPRVADIDQAWSRVRKPEGLLRDMESIGFAAGGELTPSGRRMIQREIARVRAGDVGSDESSDGFASLSANVRETRHPQ